MLSPHYILILLIVAFSIPVEGCCDSFPHGARTRGEYLRIRNLDPAGNLPIHATKWVALADEMNSLFIRSGPTMPVRDLLFAADTQMRVYQTLHNRDYLTRAQSISDALLSRATEADSDLGDALILRGDIAVAQGNKEGAADEFYRRAETAGGGVARQALQRRQSLLNGTFAKLTPNNDLETPRVFASTAATSRRVVKRIILDPGHGGFDSGATTNNGMAEKEITLDIAKRVKETLEKDPSIVVHLTRTDDVFVPLARRTAFANRKQGDAFVSLHLNASPSHSVRGIESYYLDMTDDDASRLLAERENGVPHGGEVDDLTFILSDLIQSGKLEESVELSHHLQASVHKASLPVYREAKSHGVKKGPFYVLVGAHMPCTLIELFFIDHPQDGAKLATEPFRSIVSNGLAEGLTRFALGTPTDTSAPAERAQLRRASHGPKRSSRRRLKDSKL